ncbi:MAG: PA2778 family cysteine peptidase [Pseudohongiella sp.]|nr:PA2778 family cysteine peptidase [Pseudohongiella sp.]MDO9521974.1 PA2778 family cysteine peptidase [Pseudohongiella sp.]MDP2128609.1 PA2778 family cysteine peptidase [Pseudohongiella sp.]
MLRAGSVLQRVLSPELTDHALSFRAWISLVMAFTLAACVSSPQTESLHHAIPAPLSSPVNLSDVAFFPQADYQCGPAALATVLNYSAVAVTPDELVPQVYIPARRGSLQIEMLAATRRYGQIAYVLSGSLSEMLQEVGNGKPVLVMQNLGLSRWPQWHYAVVVGYDLTRSEIRLRSGTIRDYVMPLALFEKTWARADHWAVVALTPGELPVHADEIAYFQRVADFEQSQSGEPAIRSWRAGLQRWPVSRLMSMGLSNQLYAQGNMPEAAQVLQQLLLADAGFASAHNNLAWISLELGDSVAALHHAQRAVELDADDDNFRSTLQAVQSKISSGK